MGTRDLLDVTTRHWLESIGIRAIEVVDKSWPNSNSQVSRIAADGGRRFYLKRFASSVKCLQAFHAYQHWLPGFEALVPRLVSANLKDRLLLLSDVGDCCCEWQELSLEQLVSLQVQAGRFLRALHDVPFVDEDLMAVGDAVLVRVHALQRKIEQAKTVSDHLSCQRMTRIVDGVVEVLPLLNRMKRVPCHRDFWRRNWLWINQADDAAGDVSLGVLDFEHARPDLFVFDFVKLWSDSWLAHPQLEQAFWDGYGRMLSDDEHTLLKRCAAIHAVQTIIWAAEHQNMEFVAQGKRLLDAAEG